MHILFFTEISPYPTNRGERIRSYGLLKALSETGHTVTAIIGNNDKISLDQKQLKNIRYVEYIIIKSTIKHNIKRYYAHFHINSELTSLLDSIIKTEKPEVAFIDYNFYGELIPWFKKRNLFVIYGTHNAQAALLLQKPAKSIRRKLSRFREFFVMQMHERKYFNKADALISVSELDRDYHQKFARAPKHYVIPNFLDENLYNSNGGSRENTIVMMANFYAYQNFAGLEWFINHVWNDELAALGKLVILGVNSQNAFKTIAGNRKIENIEVLGPVEDIRPYNQRAKVSIVPLLHGSGSRLKCLESMALKTQLVSTSKGAEGIDHKGSILIADKPLDFREKLISVMKDDINTTEEAYNLFIEKYSLKPNAEILKELIYNLRR